MPTKVAGPWKLVALRKQSSSELGALLLIQSSGFTIYEVEVEGEIVLLSQLHH